MKKNLDMTEGKPISLLWAFTFPTLMGNLLNQVYSITDSIVVGRYLGQTALAAVGSTMPVILLLAALMIGINVGVGIIISRYFGQKNEELMRMRRQDLRLHGKLLRQITVLAIPIAVQSAFNNLGNLVAQSAVNLFGEATMAAYTAASRIGTLALMPVETIGSSLSVYASQNHGAGKPQRIRQGVRASLQLSLVVSTVLGVFLLLCGRQMAGLFLAEPSAEILTVVQRFLLITAVPGILAGVMQVYQQVLRGVDRANQALMGGVMQLITKIVVVAVGAWGMRNLDVVWLGWPASFVAGTVIPYFCFQKIVREIETE